MSTDLILNLYVLALGMILGSYLNVVIYRLPRQISTVFPRSRCFRCRAPIRAFDNIPVFSYLVLRGKCRRCGVAIPWRYPMVEALMGLCAVLSLRVFGVSFEMPVAVGFCAAMIVLAMIDLEHYLLPDVLTLPGLVVGLVLQPWLSWSTVKEAWVGAALGAGILFLIAYVWYLLKGIWGMGMGDVKMLAMVGAFLGWRGVVMTLLIGSLTGSIIGGAMMLRGRMHMQSKLQFGTCLALGAVIALFWGDVLLDSYWNLAGLVR